MSFVSANTWYTRNPKGGNCGGNRSRETSKENGKTPWPTKTTRILGRKDDALEVPQKVEDPDVDQQKTNQWLRNTGLKGETESLMIAAQDLRLTTRSYHHCIIKDATDPHCRICEKFEESIYHIVSGCLFIGRSAEVMKSRQLRRGMNTSQQQ